MGCGVRFLWGWRLAGNPFGTSRNLPQRHDFAIAMDGPIAPTPAWKFIVEVNDQSKLQSAIALLLQKANAEAAAHGRPSASFDQLEEDGITRTMIRQEPIGQTGSSDPSVYNRRVDIIIER